MERGTAYRRENRGRRGVGAYNGREERQKGRLRGTVAEKGWEQERKGEQKEQREASFRSFNYGERRAGSLR